MPLISDYGWPVGSIVTPIVDRTPQGLYPVGQDFIIDVCDSGEQIVKNTRNGSQWTGLDADWELISLPYPGKLFPAWSKIRLVSYPIPSFQHRESDSPAYGPVGTIATVIDQDHIQCGDCGIWEGNNAVWELVETGQDQTKGTEMIEGKMYEITDNTNGHGFRAGDWVLCTGEPHYNYTGKAYKCRSLKTSEEWWVRPSDCKPAEGEYKRKYVYVKVKNLTYRGRYFSQEFAIPVFTDRSSHKIMDNWGSNQWVYFEELPSDLFEEVRVEEPLPFDPVLAKWGTDYDYYHISVSSFNWNKLNEWLIEHLRDKTKLEGVNVYARIAHFNPAASRKVRGQIALNQTRDKADRDIQTPLKPGRAFKLMFPELTDAQTEVLVDAYRASFPVVEYKLHVSEEAEHFKLAYSGNQEPMQNPYTTSARKSLANSCMRYEFDNLPHHPAEAYASGEFKIFYTTGPRGFIGSRCVVWYDHKSGRPVAGPIYGVCEHSIDTIAEALEKEDAFMYGEESWAGAKMQKIRYGREGVIAPYLDGCCQSLKDEGDCLVVGTRGQYDASSYNGVLGGFEYYCADCGEGVDEDDMHYSDHTDEHYCESCFSQSHSRCSFYDEYYPNSEIHTAYQMRRGRRYEVSVSQRAIDEGIYIYCESDCEYWHEGDVVTDHNDEYLDPITAENDYFLCQWTDRYWPNDQQAALADGTLVAISEVEGDEDYFLNADGKYEKKEEEAA